MGELSINKIEQRIFTIRCLQVMLDRDLAELYQVPSILPYVFTESGVAMLSTSTGIIQRLETVEKKQIETDKNQQYPVMEAKVC